MRGFSEANPGRSKSPRMSDFCEEMAWPTTFSSVRIVGPVMAYCQIWFTVKSEEGKESSFPKLCLDFDGENDTFSTDICPYRAMGAGREAKEYWVNVIDRNLQEDRKYKPLKGSEAKEVEMLGYKCKLVTIAGNGGSKTPVRALRIPSSAAETLQALTALNKKTMKDGTKKAFESSHPRYGFDISIKYDAKGKGTAKYAIQKGDASALSEEELEYGIWKLDCLKPEPLAVAKKEASDIKKRAYIKGKKDEPAKKFMDDDEDESPKKKGKRAVIDDDDVIDMNDDDEDESPKKKKKRPVDDEDDDEPPVKKKKKPVDDDDDEDEPPVKKKKKPIDDLDDDLDDDDDGDGDSDDDDDEPPAKKKKRPVDDDDEDEPPVKKKKRPVDDDDDEDEPPKKKRKPVDDDDEDEPPRKKKKPIDDDDDEDEPPVRKKKRPVDDDDDEDEPPKKKPKKKRPVDDDDDE